MPATRRSNIGRRRRQIGLRAGVRSSQTAEDRTQSNAQRQLHDSQSRASQSDTQRQTRQASDRLRHQSIVNHHNREQRNSNRQDRRHNVVKDLNRAAFQYDPTIEYSLLSSVSIGPMNIVCRYCEALRFDSEAPGLCCAKGKVKLPALTSPPEPLRALLYGDAQQSKHFLANTQQYNGCFQMTSFGAEVIELGGFNPTFKVISILL